MASSRNASVPGQAENQWSALDAVLDSLGSMQMTVAPFCWPSMIRWACGLK